jgi:uncharacterized protein YabN with tetrapyrrole methylase and pyrophosphatase domain
MLKNVLKMAVDVGLRDRDIFDWPNVEGAFGKLKEEVGELEEILESKFEAKIFEEFSDVFFTLLQVARHLKINPEKNLEFALKKYNLRYSKMFELAAAGSTKNVKTLSPQELEVFWQQAKKETDRDLQSLLTSYINA